METFVFNPGIYSPKTVLEFEPVDKRAAERTGQESYLLR
jgi:hypothetical protein